ncbi:Pleckstrin homology domain-containing family G member 3 [Camelus dromedarius]|uniref:Pleckstrin homology domain-containing family G member 3 n=1 Tax=Camelus dromedarius TaxID=9838 RepID=A0A5N4C4J5_CAMDR|nr:Pleckstrin homology domain-containing family G member 3 [Camelus dromedarius]
MGGQAWGAGGGWAEQRVTGGLQRSRTDRTEQQRALGCPEGNGFDLREPLFILEEHELGAITEESADASPDSASPTKLPSPAHQARELKELMKELSSSAQGELVTRLHPHILQLSHVMDGPVSERVKNKVYQLARQYSLWIKSKLVAARTSLQWEKVAPTIPHLQEEAEAPARGQGKRKPVLSLFNHEQPTAPEHSPPKSGSARETLPRCFSLSPSAASPKTTVPGSWPSPRSPFDMETFNWPDVRELCSKYTSHDEALQAKGGRPRSLPVSRSRSLPENMMEPPLSGRVGRCCSLKARRGPGGPEAAQSQPPGGSPQGGRIREERHHRPHPGGQTARDCHGEGAPAQPGCGNGGNQQARTKLTSSCGGVGAGSEVPGICREISLRKRVPGILQTQDSRAE